MIQNQPHFYRGRFSVAPMLDWTTRHCRYFHRQFSQHALLYTEMVTTGAIIHAKYDHLEFSPAENPVALQLGGSDPANSPNVQKSHNSEAIQKSISMLVALLIGCKMACSVPV